MKTIRDSGESLSRELGFQVWGAGSGNPTEAELEGAQRLSCSPGA